MKRRRWTVIGLMSGTSTDGIDAALVALEERAGGYSIGRSEFHTFEYAPVLRRRLLGAAEGEQLTAEGLSRLHCEVGQALAVAVKRLQQRARWKSGVELVGSHGHTIFHGPPGSGVGTPSTLQIGEPAVIAADSKITTVADFRPADVAVGGQGAPLAPYVHGLLFRHANRTRAIHNLGGISNVTYIPSRKQEGGIIAFDTGPANMVIDAATAAVTNGRQRFDRDGRLAARGQVDAVVLGRLLHHPYLRRSLPKSTGREEFGRPFVDQLLAHARKRRLAPADIIATATAFTAHSIAQAYQDFLSSVGRVDEVFCCGGGSRNPTLMSMIRNQLRVARLGVTDELGVNADAVEAIAFAVLAVETVRARPANLPAVTGAGRAVIMGKIVPGEPRAFRRLMTKAARGLPQTITR
jgi:anhydro-N-acetylmuramic acid kinase